PTTTGGFNTGALSDLNLQTAQSTPLATSAGTVILNLPAGSKPPTGGAFDPTNPATYNQSTSTTVFDSLGNSFPATFFFTQTATAGKWNVNMTVNNVLNATTNTLTFSSTGAVTPVGGASLNFPGFTPTDGAAA